MLLEGDSALVTGAGNGIGRGMADALEKEGARVFRADVAEADLSRPEGAAKLADEAIRRLGKVSHLCALRQPAPAGIQTVTRTRTFEQWREMLAVNLDAAFCFPRRFRST